MSARPLIPRRRGRWPLRIGLFLTYVLVQYATSSKLPLEESTIGQETSTMAFEETWTFETMGPEVGTVEAELDIGLKIVEVLPKETTPAPKEKPAQKEETKTRKEPMKQKEAGAKKTEEKDKQGNTKEAAQKSIVPAPTARTPSKTTSVGIQY